MLVACLTTSEDILSSPKFLVNSPKGESFEVSLDPMQTEALRDFAGTFGISLAYAARIIISEYLDRAGYTVEMVPYETE